MYIDERVCRSVLIDYELKGAFKSGDYHFSVDSRTIQAHEIFVPFKGEMVDGHAYLCQALEQGAGALVSYAYVSVVADLLSQEKYKHAFVILIENPEKAFLDLVCAWRRQLTIPVVGVTGSLGKTSTKVILGHIGQCAGKKVFVSHANQNTLLGIALNISRVTKEHELAVFEMGISQVGEMRAMALFLHPTHAVITCIAHSHVAGLGSYTRIAHEKRAIFSTFTQMDIGCINGDQPELKQVAYAHPIVSFGFKMHNQIQARKLHAVHDKLSFTLRMYDKKYAITLAQNHKGLVLNVLAATAVAYVLGIAPEIIVDALSSIPVRSQRFEQRLLAHQKGYIIDDCYNACPESMKVALMAFDALPFAGKKIAILADMLELGDKSLFWHRQLGRFLKKVASIDTVIFVGSQMAQACQVAPAVIKKAQTASWQEALEQVQSSLCDDVMVLVKGSHGMQLHHVVTALAKHD